MPHISLKTIPEDVYAFIVKTQGEIKVAKKSCKFSLESTVIKLLKEIKEVRERKKAAA